MFGFGRKKVEEAEQGYAKLAEAIGADIDAYVRDHMVPTRENYLGILKETMFFDETGEISPAEAGYQNFTMLMQEWSEGACSAFHKAGQDFVAPFARHGFDDISEAVMQRLNGEVSEQTFILACDGIEFVREAIAAHLGEPPLNGAGMNSIRQIVRMMGDPNADIDWGAVFRS
ncbi:hypothetical protein [Sphingomonas astaxanthinifaciens]|uniref:Uncharacterized protein n=1 Tax=Sphingomonas astaxanthinifaciens DSM 22298 TaxID=1123267 RepID=A0ABQ5ZDK7_9SPHN|nr:hypothetical protein [Sphingomonas astaxanthinifaciens]GLR48697.1 hypothetical protein GCM10007925_24170 [Sphingomonas astaxanthinifaciens DSM 22298]